MPVFGAKLDTNSQLLKIKRHSIDHFTTQLPTSFDSRRKWSQCKDVIGKVYDQGGCGGCWAIASVTTMNDRICIQSNGNIKVELSANNLMTCCKSCGEGCEGGYTSNAFKYWLDTGICTGGEFGATNTCQPYLFPKCAHCEPSKYPECTKEPSPTQCQNICQEYYSKPYLNDIHTAKEVYRLEKSETNIMREIYAHGSVTTTMKVYEDLFYYLSGVYEHVYGADLGLHSIKIIGWGVENNISYWLCVNSWNEEWGIKGLFKIVSGRNECDIESHVMTGIPKL